MMGRRFIVAVLAIVVASVAQAGPPETGPAPPAEAAGRMKVPDGFKVTLFASEPDVHQPIAFTIDSRGRLWVVECYAYPLWLGGPAGKDRILIFEDKDCDGRFDTRKVFWEGGTNLTGMALGFGGVWVCATPNLLFIPDRDGDDVPDGEPVVKLDGWDVKAQHNMFNALAWAPDGWLWGCNGIMSNSLVGKPGTPAAGRTPINCGVWRYHPTREVFEVVAHGTTNPWGLDFDEHGEAFITNCVMPHLYRVVPGARFERMYGQDFNPYTYALMGATADHIHWAGGRWQDSREGKGKHGEAGGGHAHVGAMIYLGDNWPDRYRGSVFTCNVHGHRVNNDYFARKGSGFTATHGADFLHANDDWFRGLELKYGPDGGVYLTDWSDTAECHETDADGSHRENGRIYKITFGATKKADVDLARLDDAALVDLLRHKNDWYARNARRLLQERAASGRPMRAVHAALRDTVAGDKDEVHKLRALWGLHATGGTTEADLIGLTRHENEWLRNWAVRLIGDRGPPGDEAVRRLGELARDEPSALVRLSVASALQRLALPKRMVVAAGLLARQADADDPSLPLMIWYGVEPLIAADATVATSLSGPCEIPLVRRFLARRAVDQDQDAALRALSVHFQNAREARPEAQRDLLDGTLEALKGRRRLKPPAGWEPAYANLGRSKDDGVRERADHLALLFGDPKAASSLGRVLNDRDAPVDRRQRALHAVVGARIDGLAQTLRGLLDDPPLRAEALKALAATGDESTPLAILDRYAAFNESEKDDAVATLASRPAYALALLDAVGAGKVPRGDVSVTVARQLLGLGDPRVAEALAKHWGTIRPTRSDKAALLAKYRALLTPETPHAADLSHGRAVFQKACAQCHRLFDAGGDVGPDLTGSDRANAGYILENVLDPSAAVGREFQLTTIATADGRVISGIVREETGRALTIQTANERVVVGKDEIDARKTLSESMMPEGLFEKLEPDEIRDLVAYLAAKEQVPLPRAEPPAEGVKGRR